MIWMRVRDVCATRKRTGKKIKERACVRRVEKNCFDTGYKKRERTDKILFFLFGFERNLWCDGRSNSKKELKFGFIKKRHKKKRK
jgi:hypothetical protein